MTGCVLVVLERHQSSTNVPRRFVRAKSNSYLICSPRLALHRPENLKEAVDFILSKLRGIKKVDLFECARVDPNIPIEETIKVLSEYVEQGKFDFIGMSECAAETLRRGHKVHPIAAVEIEISPWSYEEETKRGTSID